MWKVFNKTPKENHHADDLKMPKGNAKLGQQIYFEQCGGCHDMDGDQNSDAPPLRGIMGQKAGSTQYSYSRAIRRSDILWTIQNMFKFLNHPARMIPGNKMIYPGLHDPQKRAHIIAFLQTY